MTTLKVKYQCGEYTATEDVEVADDEEYWFEEEPFGKCSLCVRNVGERGDATRRTRLVIFNLCRVEALPG